jgi:hypothetical protein
LRSKTGKRFFSVHVVNNKGRFFFHITDSRAESDGFFPTVILALEGTFLVVTIADKEWGDGKFNVTHSYDRGINPLMRVEPHDLPTLHLKVPPPQPCHTRDQAFSTGTFRGQSTPNLSRMDAYVNFLILPKLQKKYDGSFFTNMNKEIYLARHHHLPRVMLIVRGDTRI